MFTGIIQAKGSIQALRPNGGDISLSVAVGKLPMSNVALGDSIAVNGVCLTVVTLTEQGFTADVSRESLSLTSLGNLRQGSAVNLEKALTLQDHLGGHLVSGHVDGLAVVKERRSDARSEWFRLQAPDHLAHYIATKGSVTLDGTSLTVNRVAGVDFEINIIPQTLQETIIDSYQVGTAVNLEVDLVARYLERLLQGGAGHVQSSGISAEFLAEHGYGGKAS